MKFGARYLLSLSTFTWAASSWSRVSWQSADISPCVDNTGGILTKSKWHTRLNVQIEEASDHCSDCVWMLNSIISHAATSFGYLGRAWVHGEYRYKCKTVYSSSWKIHGGTCTIINDNGGRTFSYLYRSLVPSLPYLVIVFCYARILGTFRRVQHRMDKHRASVISKVRNCLRTFILITPTPYACLSVRPSTWSTSTH